MRSLFTLLPRFDFRCLVDDIELMYPRYPVPKEDLDLCDVPNVVHMYRSPKIKMWWANLYADGGQALIIRWTKTLYPVQVLRLQTYDRMGNMGYWLTPLSRAKYDKAYVELMVAIKEANKCSTALRC